MFSVVDSLLILHLLLLPQSNPPPPPHLLRHLLHIWTSLQISKSSMGEKTSFLYTYVHFSFSTRFFFFHLQSYEAEFQAFQANFCVKLSVLTLYDWLDRRVDCKLSCVRCICLNEALNVPSAEATDLVLGKKEFFSLFFPSSSHVHNIYTTTLHVEWITNLERTKPTELEFIHKHFWQSMELFFLLARCIVQNN